MSTDNLVEFKKQFGNEPYIESAEFDMRGGHAEIKYECRHDLMAEFRSCLVDWLDNHDFPIDFFMLGRRISLYSNEELSDAQIHDFEDDFDVKCKRYLVSCGSNRVKYEFV